MAVQHFDQEQAQELLFGQGGNQQRERGSVGCGAFLAVFQIGWRLLYKWRPGAGGVVV
jgi:hypothetical protein